MGLLRVTGTMDLQQFWPAGESDADTAKVLVNVSAGAFSFQASPGASFHRTDVFDGAEVHGKVRKPVLDKQGRVTIRLQGIDAPELHYRPQAPGKPTPAQRKAFNAVAKDFRQHLGESGAHALGAYLKQAGAGAVACRVETAVSHPNEVFDTYGRFIGDILLQLGGAEVDVNHWTVEQGWAVPTFYDSMSNDEITTIEKLAAAAKQNKRGMFKRGSLKLQLGAFDFALVYRKPKTVQSFTAFEDDGPFIVPKLFRRQSTWAAAQRAKVISKGTLHRFLLSGTPDVCYLTKEFLSRAVPTERSQPHVLAEFVDDTGRIAKPPGDLVFHEAASKVFGSDGKPVTAW